MSGEEASLISTLQSARALMRRRKQEEACNLLMEARRQSIARNALSEAAILSSIRGSYLVAMGRDEDAYRAFLDAEEESAGALQHRLTLARHLIYGMRQPEKALSKVEEVIAGQPASKATMQEALAIRGLAQLALGDSERAANSLRDVFIGYQNSSLPTQAFDLTLVEELSRHKVDLQGCRAYLDFVETQARAESNQPILDRILLVRGLLER